MFLVLCERISRRNAYYVAFEYNEQIIDRIKEFPEEDRKWNAANKVWELKTSTLLGLIKKYKGSDKIHFDFGSDEKRNIFIGLAKKHELAEIEKQKLIKDLEVKKKHWIEYKEELEKNYEQYRELVHKNLKEGTILYPHQIVGTMFLNETRNALLAIEMGLGKAQSLDSKLLTPNGYIRMGDVTINDMVAGSDGKFKKIIGIFPQGTKKIYEITFNDNSKTECCEDHIWSINTPLRESRNKIENKYPFFQKTLKEIMNDGLYNKSNNRKYCIPIIKPIEFEEKELFIHPYVLGCLLGDGGISQNRVNFSTADVEIINEINKRLPEKHYLKKKNNSKYDYSLISSDNKQKNEIIRELKSINLMGHKSITKFIPNKYKYASIEQRLELLQGILDTDSYPMSEGGIELTLASKQLIEDVQFITESLGGIARYFEKYVKYNGENRLYFKLNIKIPPQFIPFKLKRRIDKYAIPTKYLPNRLIKDIKYIGEKEAQCILVDSNDHLYCTDRCILTHNTLISISYSELNNFNKVVVITPNSLKFNYLYEVDKFSFSKSHVVGWKHNKYEINDSKYIILNYDFFNSSNKNKTYPKWDKLGIENIDCVIYDECHKLKSSKSNTYINIKKIFNKNIFKNNNISKIFLGGTPMPNASYEIYNLLHEISPLEFSNKKHFYEYYCGMFFDYYSGWGYTKDSEKMRLEELFYKIAPYTYRKRKIDVLNLPEKIYQNIVLELTPTESSTYEKIEMGVVNDFLKNPTHNPLTILIRLQQYTSNLKINYIVDFVNNILESGEKVVIIDKFKDSLYKLKEIYGDIGCLHTGDQSVEERAEMVNQFQDVNSNIKIFIGSVATCNYGITLTASCKLINITPLFVPGEFLQLSDRIHRIGQENIVNIYSPIFNDTIDQYIMSVYENKMSEIVKVMDNIDYKTEAINSVLNEVMNKLKKKYNTVEIN